MKILSVDDSFVIRRIITDAVSVIGFDVVGAANGQEALDVLEREHTDINLILLDWNMPVMDGYTTLCNIRADERFSGIPVMMVTTEAERENVVRAIQAGANNYLCKPFSPQDLTTKVMESLGMGLDM